MHLCNGAFAKRLFCLCRNPLFTLRHRGRAREHRKPKGQSNGTHYANPGYGDQCPVRRWRLRRHDGRAGQHLRLSLKRCYPCQPRGLGPDRLPAPKQSFTSQTKSGRASRLFRFCFAFRSPRTRLNCSEIPNRSRTHVSRRPRPEPFPAGPGPA